MTEFSEYMAEIERLADARGMTERDRDMQRRIINSGDKVLGAKTPDVRAVAKSVPLCDRDSVIESYFGEGEHSYESTLFAGLLAARKGDAEKTAGYLRRIIPLFSSWAHVDTVVPMLKGYDRDAFLDAFSYLLDREGEYETRTYIIYMLSHCLTDDRIDFVFKTLEGVRYGRYYVDMAAAWLLSVTAVKYYDRTVELLRARAFPDFVHNKAIQKARESFRVPEDKKRALAALKVR